MKYSILGFNQEAICKLSIVKIDKDNNEHIVKLDVEDLILLNYIEQAQARPSMTHYAKNNIAFVWLMHSKILEDLPILDVKESMLKKRLQKLEEFELIQTFTLSSGRGNGSKTFYAITEKCEKLKYEKENENREIKNSLSNDLRDKKLSVKSNREIKNYLSDNKLEIKDDNKLIEKEDISKDISKKKSGFLKHSKQDEFKIDGLVDMYNSICTKLPKVRAITDKRKSDVEKLYKKYDLSTFKEAFRVANESAFLTGDNDRGWKASFDFITREDKFIAILEGKYNSKKKSTRGKFGESDDEKYGNTGKEKLYASKSF